MNPGLKLLLVIIIALEISFTTNLIVNLALISFSVIYLLLKHISFKQFMGWFSGHSSPR